MKNIHLYMQLSLALFLGFIDRLTGAAPALAGVAGTGRSFAPILPDMSRLNAVCVDLNDDVNDGTACPAKNPGVEGRFYIQNDGNVTDLGSETELTGTWDSDVILEGAETFFTHDTDEDVAQLAWAAVEGTGDFDVTVTLFYKGFSALRRQFFDKAHRLEEKFTVIVVDKAGNQHLIDGLKVLPNFDTQNKAATTAAGWSVTMTKRGRSPYPYTGAIV